MANASELRLSYVEEVTYGTTPASAMDDIRFTSEGLKQRTDVVQSQEIRADRQVADIIRTNIGAEGPLGFELSYGAFDPFLMAALFSSAWSSPITVGPKAMSTTPSTGLIAEDVDADSFANFTVGEWVKVTGFTDPANDGYFKVTATPAGDASINVAGMVALPAETATSLTVVRGGQIVNGVSPTFYSIEKEWTDLSNKLAIYRGMMIDQFSLEVPADGIITGSFGWLGKHEASLAATAGNGTKNAAPSNEVMNAIDNAKYLVEGALAVNTANTFQAMQASFSLANQIRQRNVIGTLGPIEQKAGTIELTGTLRAYFSSETILDKYLNFTQSALSIITEDDDGNALIFEIPAAHYEDAQRVAGGIDTDIIADLSFRARRHATEDVMLRIVRFAA